MLQRIMIFPFPVKIGRKNQTSRTAFHACRKEKMRPRPLDLEIISYMAHNHRALQHRQET